MLKNYLLTALRNLRRNRVNTLINVVGLALSIACCLVVYAFIRHQYSFDHFHTHADRTYRVVSQYRGNEGVSHQGNAMYPVARALRNDFPELPLVTQVVALNEAVVRPEEAAETLKFDYLRDYGLMYTDEHFWQIFDYPLLAGQRDGLLTRPDEVVLTQAVADRLYGKAYQNNYEVLLGKTLLVNKVPYRITGVLPDIPRNSNVIFGLVLPLAVYEQRNEWVLNNWQHYNSTWRTFVMLPEGISSAQQEAQLVGFKDKYHDEEQAARRTYHLQPLAEVHTDERYGGTMYVTPAILIGAFVGMGIIVLLTAGINFINLSTAQSVRRAKEIGIRKTLGSGRGQLMGQFLTEVLLLTLLAAGLALALADWFIDAYNQYVSPVIDFGLAMDGTVVYFLVALCTVVTLLAGYYPARVLAGFRPVEALKQSLSHKPTGFASKFSLRKVLVVTQFVISQVLIIGTLIITAQMHYVRTQDLGFRQENVAVAFVPDSDPERLDAFRNRIVGNSAVEQVSFASGPPLSTGRSNTRVYNPQRGAAENHLMEQKSVDQYYLTTFDILLVAGRNLRADDQVASADSLSNYNVLLNETAVKMLGFASPEDALEQTIVTSDDRRATVVGVVADFNNISLHSEIRPCLLAHYDWVNLAAVQFSGPHSIHDLAFVRDAWQQTYPDEFYEAQSISEYFAESPMYIIEDLMYQAFKIFAFLAIVIGCLGLYGLVSYLSLQRQKEIGVRKVLGASAPQIVYLFSKEFTLLVLLAFVIAAPLGYLAMQAWLETFAYRIELSIAYFALALLASVGIAWITVGYKSVRAALANPVDALRSE